jgi:hypothetical protein
MNKCRWISLLLFSSINLYAADSTIVSFSIGNRYAFGGWQHSRNDPNYYPLSYSEEIIADTIINGRHYFEFYRPEGSPIGSIIRDTSKTSYRRADSSAVYQYNIFSASEDTIVDFKDSIGTVYHTYFSQSDISQYTITSKDSVFFFGKWYSAVGINYSTIYASKLYLVKYEDYNLLTEKSLFLKGAKIDGVYYGDSTLVSVNPNFSMNPTCVDYVLYQNYPNPFNPTTIISYRIGILGKVSLKIYDLLGRELVTLVNEVKPAGSYSATFNASNLSSDVYFYRLTTGNYTFVKKLLLLK